VVSVARRHSARGATFLAGEYVAPRPSGSRRQSGRRATPPPGSWHSSSRPDSGSSRT
jgi:hypothetical protein